MDFSSVPMSKLHPTSSVLQDMQNPYDSKVNRQSKVIMATFEQKVDFKQEFNAACMRKALLCSIHGLLVHLTLRHPSSILATCKLKTILNSRRPSFCLGRSLGDYKEHAVLILEDSHVRAIALESGATLYNLDVTYAIDTLADAIDDRSSKYSVSNQQMKGLFSPLVQIEPCAVHWCQYTSNIIVGFVDGSVTLYYMEDGYLSVKSFLFEPTVCERLYSQNTHTGAISTITSFRIKAASQKEDAPHDTWLVVGDVNGTLSLWYIPFIRSE